MTTFWILTAAMVALAFVFVLPPLLRGRAEDRVNRDDLNVAVIRQELQELQADLNNGNLSREDYEAARADLERELLYDLEQGKGGDTPTDTPTGKSASSRWIAIVVALTVPIVAFPLYQHLGSSRLIPLVASGANTPAAGGQNQTAAASDKPLPSIEEMVSRLEERLQSEPENIEGWFMLGRSYSVMGRYADAAGAFKRADQLAGSQDATIIAYYAEALSQASGGQMSGRPTELIDLALKLEPDNRKALWLNGYTHFQKGEYAASIQTWERLLALLSTDNEDRTRVQDAIRVARSHMSGEAPGAVADATAGSGASSAGTQAAAAGASAIEVHVSLDDAVRDRAAPGDTVFIFARALQGPRMPLAIARKTVAELPATVVLDDSMAMTPAMALSRFAQVALEARVSKSGTASPSSGDLSGRIAPVSPGQDDGVELVIDSVVP